MDRDGRMSQVRSKERPKGVRVLSRIPVHIDERDDIESRDNIPKSDKPSFVLSEWMDAWLSFSNIWRELYFTG